MSNVKGASVGVPAGLPGAEYGGGEPKTGGAPRIGACGGGSAVVLSHGTRLPCPHSQKTIDPAVFSGRPIVLPHLPHVNQIMEALWRAAGLVSAVDIRWGQARRSLIVLVYDRLEAVERLPKVLDDTVEARNAGSAG